MTTILKQINIVRRRKNSEQSNIISCGSPSTSVYEINDDDEEEEEEEGNFSKARRK
jgi:hypothetical protein